MSTGYIDGLVFTRTGNTAYTIGAGSCRDSTDTRDLRVTSTLTFANVNSGSTGVLNIDTGSFASGTCYYTYIIASADGATVSATYSLNATTPTLPAGYTLYRRVGTWTSLATGKVADGFQRGQGRDRTYIYSATTVLLSTTSPSTSWAAIDCSAFAPPNSTIIVNGYFENAATANNILTFGSVTGTTLITVERDGPTSDDVYANFQFEITTDASGDFYYDTNGTAPTLNMWVTGFREFN